MLRHIKFIVVHCTQTSREVDADLIRRAMIEDNRRSMFHGMIDRCGYFMRLMGCNLLADNSIKQNLYCYHLAYVGGLNAKGEPCDTRTPVQCHALYEKLEELHQLFPEAKIVGADHFTGDETVSPCFDVRAWLEYYKDHREDWVEIEEPEESEEEWKSAS